MMIYLLSRTISGGGHETNTWAIRPTWSQRSSTRLTVLASIEARYRHELASLERFGSSASGKEHLRQQLASGRNSAREPHVLRLADLHQQMLQATMAGQAKHEATPSVSEQTRSAQRLRSVVQQCLQPQLPGISVRRWRSAPPAQAASLGVLSVRI